MNSINVEGLGKSIVFLLESLADILSACGPPLNPARENLRKLLRSDKILDPGVVKRHAYYLSNLTEEIADRLKSGTLDVRGEDDPAADQAQSDGLGDDSADLLLAIVKHMVFFRPNLYQEQVLALESLICSRAPLEEIFRTLTDMILQIRLDFWEERSKAFKHIEDVFKVLEVTERDFISSLDANHEFAQNSNQVFTTAMEEGLKDLGSLGSPGKCGLEEICLHLSQKVGRLQECVLRKKRDDHAQIDILATERKEAEKRFIHNQCNYEEFNRQSHEMRLEIEHLRVISLRDPLTETCNRRAYNNQVVKLLAAYKAGDLKTCSMIVFDIDNFREFNNSYGHLAGDRVLAYVAKLAKRTLRCDDAVFRYGGDEFVILLPNASQEAAFVVAEKVRSQVAAMELKIFKNSNVTARVTISMGVSEIKEGDDQVSFFNRGDQALYMSKKTGRNRVSPSFPGHP